MYVFLEQVNIEILRNNKVYHSVEDPVSLTLLLKNVPELEVRIYQIDCKEYFLRFKDRVNLDIPLDGLAPNFVIQKHWDESHETPLLQRTSKPFFVLCWYFCDYFCKVSQKQRFFLARSAQTVVCALRAP